MADKDDMTIAIAGKSNGLSTALADNLDGGSLDMGWGDLTRIPTPMSGQSVFMFTNALGEEVSVKVLKGVIVAKRAGGVVWPSATPQKGAMPVIRSDDGITGKSYNEDIGDLDPDELEKYKLGDDLYDWKGLVTKSKYGRKGDRRCKESTDVALLCDGELFPVVLKIGPGSNAAWQSFLRALIGKGLSYYKVVVEFNVKQAESRGGISYSMMVPTLVDTLDDEVVELIKTNYVDQLS